MSKFHINSKGAAGICRASDGGCPFGGEHEHYPTKEDARNAYENNMKDSGALFNPKNKNAIHHQLLSAIRKSPETINNFGEKEVEEISSEGYTRDQEHTRVALNNQLLNSKIELERAKNKNYNSSKERAEALSRAYDVVIARASAKKKYEEEVLGEVKWQKLNMKAEVEMLEAKLEKAKLDQSSHESNSNPMARFTSSYRKKSEQLKNDVAVLDQKLESARRYEERLMDDETKSLRLETDNSTKTNASKSKLTRRELDVFGGAEAWRLAGEIENLYGHPRVFVGEEGNVDFSWGRVVNALPDGTYLDISGVKTRDEVIKEFSSTVLFQNNTKSPVTIAPPEYLPNALNEADIESGLNPSETAQKLLMEWESGRGLQPDR